MKTLNEKAREYAGLKNIPDEEERYYQYGKCRVYDAYIAGSTEMNRWRDVNVELPEPKQKGLSDNVLLKYSVNGLIHDNTYECCVQAFYCHDTEMWHSLMPLDDDNLKLTPIAWRPIETI